jgi:hypothetical protein
MKSISINMARDIAFGVDACSSCCAECLFEGYDCSGFQCAVGNVLKRLVDGGFLSIDENADTNLPTSAKRSEDQTPEQFGEDINVSATLPAWCKVGQWVFHNGCHLVKIEGFETVSEDGSTSTTTYVVLRSYDTHNELPFTRLLKQIQPVRFRGYSFEEAKGLLGKVMDYSCDNGPFSGRSEKSTLITNVSNGKYGILINGDFFRDLSERFNATINGIPIGVPVIDEEALKEASDGEHEL